jgi:hypothetical protein
LQAQEYEGNGEYGKSLDQFFTTAHVGIGKQKGKEEWANEIESGRVNNNNKEEYLSTFHINKVIITIIY